MTPDEQAIRNLVKTWMHASTTGDTAKLLGLMADDVLFHVPGREPFGKDTFAAGSRSMSTAKITGTNEIIELKILGDWAWMRNHIRVTIVQSGWVPTVRSGYTLTILRREPHGHWVIVRDANLLGPETK